MKIAFRTLDNLTCIANCPDCDGDSPRIMRPLDIITTAGEDISPLSYEYRAYERTGEEYHALPVYREIREKRHKIMNKPESPVIEYDLKDVRRRLAELEKAQRAQPPSPSRVAIRDEQCGNCRFWLDFRCHRFPPYAGEEEDCFPAVPKTAWCGEWKKA